MIPVLRSLGDVLITASDVKLVGDKHPIVQDALDLLRRFPHSSPIRPPRPFFGGISVDEVYVYPLGKTDVTIYHLAFPDVPVWPSNSVVRPVFVRRGCLVRGGTRSTAANPASIVSSPHPREQH